MGMFIKVCGSLICRMGKGSIGGVMGMSMLVSGKTASFQGEEF